jgi:N-acyl-D-aspartate/D-glutamate deacylase
MPSRFAFWALLVCLAITLAAAQHSVEKKNPVGFTGLARTLLIRSVQIVDGSGSKSFRGSVRIQDSSIIAVGDLQPIPTDSIIDGTKLVLAPGFIDTHSHHFGDFDEDPSALATNSQGITTIVIGQDGNSYSVDTIRALLKKNPLAVNVATYTGHTTLREQIMGNDLLRPATQKEIKQMQALLAKEMRKGSLGLSSGLEYEDAFYSSTQEVLQLAQTAARYNGSYTSHIRSEDITLDTAIEEILTIGRLTKMPVNISHIKIGLKDKWGTAPAILQRLEKARSEGIQVTADVYPYDFWSSTLRVLFPKRDYANVESAAYAVDHLFDPEQSVLVRYAPQPMYIGKTITHIAALQNKSTPLTLLHLIEKVDSFKKANPAHPYGLEAIAAKAMKEEDVTTFITWPFANICSDGRSGGHPRGFGAFTKILRQYVRERSVLSLEEAIHKMTYLGALNSGIKNRGLIKEGYYADLVLFDPNTVADQSTLEQPTALSSGIEMVWINGRITYHKQKPTGERPGIFIKRHGEVNE